MSGLDLDREFGIALRNTYNTSYLRNPAMLLLFSTLLLLLAGDISTAQQRMRFKNISIEEGLSQSVVFSISQDSAGFIWIGTQDGLNCYDGYEFTIYRQISFDTLSLSGNSAFTTYADSRGRIWTGSFNGANILDPITSEVYRVHLRGEVDNPIGIANINALAEADDGTMWMVANPNRWKMQRFDEVNKRIIVYDEFLPPADDIIATNITAGVEVREGENWVGTLKRGMYRYSAEKDTFVFQSTFEPEGSKRRAGIRNILIDPLDSNVVWIAAAGSFWNLYRGLLRINTETGEKDFYMTDAEGNNYRDVFNIVFDDDGNLYAATGGGIEAFDREMETFTLFELPDNPYNNGAPPVGMLPDALGNVWIITPAADGVYHFDADEKMITHHYPDRSLENAISSDNITFLFRDNNDLIYLGSAIKGFDIVDPFSQNFRLYDRGLVDERGLRTELVRAVYEDPGGNLYIGLGNQGGLNVYSPSEDSWSYYLHDPADPYSLNDNNVQAICPGEKDYLYIGTVNGGMNKLHIPSGRFTHYRFNPNESNSISNNFVRVIYRDNEGILWIGMEGGGLNRFDPKSETFTRYPVDPNSQGQLNNNAVRTIYEYPEGTLYLGTVGGGINRFNKKTGEVTAVYLPNPFDPTSVSNSIIQYITGDGKGTLWIGTFGGGLLHFDTEKEIFTAYTLENSDICDNVVYAVLLDKYGMVWFSTNDGIGRFDPVKKRFKQYDVSDGLQSREFNGQACYQNEEGTIFFGGISGMNSFTPGAMRDNPHPPKIAITEFKLFGEPVEIGGESPLQKPIAVTDSIDLAYWQNDISFEFVALHFANPEKNRYAYRLDNFDTEKWRLSASREAVYTNLDPGEYVFRVIGSNSDGVWNKKGRSLYIIIHPPWWQTGWAYAGYGIFIIFGFALFTTMQKRSVTKRERARAEIREAILRAEAAELQSRASEAQAKALAAENMRKTQELEEARKLQLSMLPEKVPAIEAYEIGAYMKTATEVGGDYYDFLIKDASQFTAVIGDATGHGLRAGMMVSVIKSLLYAQLRPFEHIEFFANCTDTIKAMKLWNLYMALTLIDAAPGKIKVTSAGMPPYYIYRARRGEVEEIIQKGMPLGAFREFQYQSMTHTLERGDKAVFLSDGLPETFNKEMKNYGFEKVRKAIQIYGSNSPEELIKGLAAEAELWRGEKTMQDDISFLVLESVE